MAVRGLAQQEAGGRRITVGKGEQMKERLALLGREKILAWGEDQPILSRSHGGVR